MLVELAGQLGFEVVDGLLHRDDDRDEPGHGVAECLLDPWWLPMRRCLQVSEDLLGQGGVIAAAGPLQSPPCGGSAAARLPGSVRPPARSALPYVSGSETLAVLVDRTRAAPIVGR
jgi:hypothetical protein